MNANGSHNHAQSARGRSGLPSTAPDDCSCRGSSGPVYSVQHSRARAEVRWQVAVGETVILMHPTLPSVGVSIGVKRGFLQNDSLADG